LTVGLRQTAAGQTTSIIEGLPPSRTLANWQSARIAVKAKGKILLIDPADVIAFEAKGNDVLSQHTPGDIAAQLPNVWFFSDCR
jgi:hypothetical protein